MITINLATPECTAPLARRCSRCGGEGPFKKDRKRADGLSSWCKACNARQSNTMTPEQRAKARVRSAAWAEAHREESRARARKWIADNPVRNRATGAAYRARNPDAWIRRKYGMTQADLDALLAKQGGCCAICRNALKREGRGINVDHDHVTGAVRGLLCPACNKGLGLFRDSIESLSNAQAYLRAASDAGPVGLMPGGRTCRT